MPGIAVLGPGGVGAFLAAALEHSAERVTVVAREATAQRLAACGIEVDSVRLGSFIARPRAIAALEEPTPLLFVSTKATTLGDALQRIRVEPELTVPLLNGLEHMALLRERFGADRVAAGVIRIESKSPEPGRVLQTSPFLRIDLAFDDARARGSLHQVATVLERAQIPARVQDSEASVLWSKLVRLVALASTTSASNETIGFIRSDPRWRGTLAACIGEAAAVAAANGAAVDPAATLAELDQAHPSLGSSMQRDLTAGREPELDAIVGAVLRAGRRHGLECPTLARLSRLIEQRAGLQLLRA